MAEVVTFVKIRMKGKPGTFVLASRDFDPELHEMAEGASPPPAPRLQRATPNGDITGVNVAGARALVEQATTVDELAALEAAEKAHGGYPGGRAVVLTAIDKRRGELGAG